jgi:hypothetical protein
MTCKSSSGRRRRPSIERERSERASVVALFMGALVEQTIKRMEFGEGGLAADISLAQLREELGTTMAVLAAEMERIDCLLLTDETIESAHCSQRAAMLLAMVLRAWLDGDDPDLAPALSALDCTVAWSVH